MVFGYAFEDEKKDVLVPYEKTDSFRNKVKKPRAAYKHIESYLSVCPSIPPSIYTP